MGLKFLFICISFLFSFTSFALEGLFEVHGTHSKHGPYSGTMEIRRSQKSQGSYEVQRLIDYPNMQFENLQIQEVWSGASSPDQRDTLLMNFTINPFNFVTKFNGLTREHTRINPIRLVARYQKDPQSPTDLNSPEVWRASFEDSQLGLYQESMVRISEVKAQPAYEEQIEIFDAHKEPGQIVRKIIDKLFKFYSENEYVRSFKDRPEFKRGVQQFTLDKSSFDFYRQNPHRLRVVNRVLDDISFVESIGRQRAYAHTLDEKAAGFQDDLKFHINEAGMVSFANYSGDQFIGYGNDYDSTLWTGAFIGMQAYRYKLTQDPSALEAMKKSLAGLKILMDITNNPQEFARTIQVHREGQGLPQNWKRGQGDLAHYDWLPGGNNDMYKGLIHGFLMSYWIFKDLDPDLVRSMIPYAERMTQLTAAAKRPANLSMALGLKAVLTQNQGDINYYIRYLGNPIPAITTILVEPTLNILGMMDFSGIHLTTISLMNHILIADGIHWEPFQNAFREHMIDLWSKTNYSLRHFTSIAAYSFASNAKNLNKSKKKELAAAVDRAVWGLREIPYPRLRYSLSIDHSWRSDWCISPYPQMPWKHWSKENKPIEWYFQGIREPAHFEMDAYGEKYIWKSGGYDYKITQYGGEVGSGVDYLYAYWMAKYFRILKGGE